MPIPDKKFVTGDVIAKEVGAQALLVGKAFGLNILKSKFYLGGTNKIPNRNSEHKDTLQKETDEQNNTHHNSMFGLPVFDNIGISVKDNKSTLLDKSIIEVTSLTLMTCLIEVTQTKNIIVTALQGRNGTVKEYISDGDYILNIKGVLCSEYNDVYPDELVKKLKKFCLIQESIFVSSPILNDMFAIDRMVIQRYSFNQIEGSRSTVAFELECLSDNKI